MSKLSIQNHEYLEETLALESQIEQGFLVLAARLIKIRDERLYSGEYDTFEDFMEELKISRSTIYKIIAVYEKYVVMGKIEAKEVATVGWGNLSLFANMITDEKSARKIFDEVAPLGRMNAMKTLKEMKTGVDMTKCKHEWQEVHFNQCSICGDREKIYEEN